MPYLKLFNVIILQKSNISLVLIKILENKSFIYIVSEMFEFA